MITAYSADHAPPHVHVFRRGEYEIVLLLDDPRERTRDSWRRYDQGCAKRPTACGGSLARMPHRVEQMSCLN
jgi:hypothetical protein